MEYLNDTESLRLLKVNKSADQRATEFYTMYRNSLRENIDNTDFSLNQFNKEFNYLLNEYIPTDNRYYEPIIFGYISMLFNSISYGAKSKSIQKIDFIPDLIELIYYNKEYIDIFMIDRILRLLNDKEVINYIKKNYKQIETIRKKLLLEIKLKRRG
jgi:hypothetical protein